MRVLALLLALAACLCLASTVLGQCIDTYEPGCKLTSEVGYPQRHCIDPTKYWRCATLNGKAELFRCQTNTAFSQERNACVPWIDWVWRPCVEPPSRPTGWQPCN
ncbi:hypothetical protein AWZ03_003112 [Drosophila navojoa]|uniref:Chitin-binding type-2 domain-containing protein n=1 Tax=Drosophila navojoa TaxID=7232 RepID=A0A484BP27_DRONA|nr:uncharacterized protein LOC108652429 isoform X1 [Drosophila navojoa]TDG50523.1 hypothetical protein AWZ03_003112 [Drosophila navojoa]